MTRPAQFDVFLCHNSEDKPFIRDIARQLRAQSLTPWLDEEQLRGGDVWSDVVDEISQEIETVVVFVGGRLGPWQKAEISGFLHDCVDRGIRVIPVLLGNASDKPVLPFFLRGRIWIDFRQSEPDPFELLVRGITGQRSPIISVPPIPLVEPPSAQAPYFREDLGNGVTLDMVAIPGGTFLMGSPDSEAGRENSDSPQHSVTIAPFHMGKFAVTQAQYQAIVGNNSSYFKGEKRPVEQVSWEDAIAFCQKLSERTGNPYRLPSEAEWEYACRAGTTTPFYFGETITPDLVNFNGNYTYGSAPKEIYREQTIDVGSFPANGFGLHDMHGNVWEWCEDHCHNYNGVPIDGRAWVDPDASENAYRVLRGGSWVDDPRYCRSATRYGSDAGERYLNYGFRVVCVAPRT